MSSTRYGCDIERDEIILTAHDCPPERLSAETCIHSHWTLLRLSQYEGNVRAAACVAGHLLTGTRCCRPDVPQR
jgi:hypothetical protein